MGMETKGAGRILTKPLAQLLPVKGERHEEDEDMSTEFHESVLLFPLC